VEVNTVRRGQAKAINEQKNSPNIKNVVDREQIEKFPDQNAAEALQRIPGITITRDQGEGEYVSVRGLSPALNSITLNGQRIPSPDPGDERGVGIGLLQIGLMDAIVVSKSVTPEMDGDAIGGNINMKLRQAPDKKVLSLKASHGFNKQYSAYNQLGKSQQRYAITLSTRTKNKRWGLIVQSNYTDNRIGSLLNEYTYINDNSDSLQRKRWNDYDIERKRFGITASPDFRYKKGFIKFTTTTNFFKDYEIRRRVNYTTNNKREERQTRNRNEDMYLSLYQLYTENNWGRWKMDASANYIATKLDEPGISTYTYRRTNNFTGLKNDDIAKLDGTNNFPNLTTPISLNAIASASELTKDADATGTVNFERRLLQTTKNIIGFKTGFKYISKERSYRISLVTSSLATGKKDSTLAGQFGHTDERTVDVFNTTTYKPWTTDTSVNAAQYDAAEKVAAGYIQFSFLFNTKISILTGLRVEKTNVDYYHLSTKGNGKSNYSNWLPGFHFTYKPTQKINVRASYARTLSRPGYSKLVPFYNQNNTNQTISKGNPALKAADANNFDLMFEYYSDHLNFITAGLFHKKIKNLVATQTVFQTIGATQYQVSQPINGDEAKVTGFELALNQRFSKNEQSFLQHLGVYANYTFTSSEGVVEGRKLPLLSSPKHSANLSLFYENPKVGMNVSLTGVYRDYQLRTVGTNELNDIYFGKQTHVDLSVSQRIYKGLGAYLQWLNITDQDEKEFFSKPEETFSRLHQTSQFNTSFLIGLKYDL